MKPDVTGLLWRSSNLNPLKSNEDRTQVLDNAGCAVTIPLSWQEAGKLMEAHNTAIRCLRDRWYRERFA